MATTALSDITAPAVQLLKQGNGHSVLLYEEDRPVAAIISMEDYEIIRREKATRMFEACEALHREIESNGGIDEATMGELLAESN